MPRPDVSVERKQQILQAALQVFAEKGIAAATVQDVAQAAGLSIGGLYWYYKSIEDILFALVQNMVTADLEISRAQAQAQGSVRERLRRIVTTGLLETARAMPLYLEVYRLAIANPAMHAELQNYLTAYHDLFSALLTEGCARGEFRQLDVQAAALVLIAWYQGMMELSLIAPNRIEIPASFESGLNLLLESLG
jgi:AcrR family transcriptional regulator